jgi:hypothetical protein
MPGSPKLQQNQMKTPASAPATRNGSPKFLDKSMWKLETGLSDLMKKKRPSPKNSGPVHDLNAEQDRQMSPSQAIQMHSPPNIRAPDVPVPDQKKQSGINFDERGSPSNKDGQRRISQQSKASTLTISSQDNGQRGSVPSFPGKVRIKCHYKDEKRVFVLDQDQLTIDNLRQKLMQKFQVQKLRIRYRDEDNELVLMSDREDLDTAIMFMRNSKLEISVE